MQTPAEILRAEILDWWEAERDRIAEAVPERLPALLDKVDKIIDDMSASELLKRGKFGAEKVEPVVTDWIERLYKELAHELDESFRASAKEAEGGETYKNWSYGEMATAGAAIAVSAAPAAGIPLFAGGLTTASLSLGIFTFGGGALIPMAVTAAAGSAVLLAAGPSVRANAVSKLKSKFKVSIHAGITQRVLDSGNKSKVNSLKEVLFNELQGVALKRMDVAS
ncbi:hypothetical protein N9741_03465 [Octadecabacter sp.]|nr:hypothetical protein [Octadecabacter sp.]